jgi:hypothetical protein
MTAPLAQFQHMASPTTMALSHDICSCSKTASNAGMTLACFAGASTGSTCSTCSESGYAATDGFRKGVLSPHSFISLTRP